MKSGRGYTLLELLIVIAILAVVAALASPALWSRWGQTRVEGAGHLVRAALGRARVEAIESATPYQFRFRPGTAQYQYGPAVQDKSEDGATFETLDSDSGGSDSRDPEDLIVEDELPDGVWFVDPTSAELEFAGSVRLENSPGEASELDSSEAVQWSEPIIFYPNGRSMSARIRLAGIDHREVEVVLRGLTGTAKVGKSIERRPDDEEHRDRGEKDVNEPIREPAAERAERDESEK